MIPLKRVHLIAEALSLVDGIQLEWVHFGDGKERSRVEEILEKLNSDQVKVQLMGRRTNSEILEWFAQKSPDLFINVSTTEGIPVSIMEAMSFGTPVLATDVGGTSEIVNSENGQLLPADLTPELLAERIQAFFLSSEETQQEKRESALKMWESNYNAATNYARFAESLKS
jgi:glycosyltransferase involved in cell wall biosynthesis